MARRSGVYREDSERPSLLVSRAEAKAKIQTQIDKGKQLLDRPYYLILRFWHSRMPGEEADALSTARLREARRTPAKQRAVMRHAIALLAAAPHASAATQVLSWLPEAFKGAKAGPACPRGQTSHWQGLFDPARIGIGPLPGPSNSPGVQAGDLVLRFAEGASIRRSSRRAHDVRLWRIVLRQRPALRGGCGRRGVSLSIRP